MNKVHWTRIFCAIAIITILLESVAKAMGLVPQTLFSQNGIWLWWISAIGWFYALYCLVTEDID